MSKWDDLACPKCGESPNGLDVELMEKHYSRKIKHGSWEGFAFDCFDCKHVVTVKVETRDKRDDE
jgi:hypothetical protein